MDSEKTLKLYETTPYDFRWAKKEDWKEAMMMVWKTFMRFEASDYTEEGVKLFFEFITDDDIYKAFLGGTYRMLLAFDSRRIIGVGTVRNKNILSLLFVDEAYHRKGVGSILLGLLGDYVRSDLARCLRRTAFSKG